MRRSSAFILLAALGCGGPQAQTFPHHRNADMVVWVTFGDKRPASFDPRSPDPRVHAAYTQLSKLVGHDVEFHFDDALVPEWTDFDDLFAQCLETVDGDLARLAHEHPDVFARASKSLDRIEVTYDATAAQAWSSSVDAHGNVQIVLVPDTSRLIPEGAVSSALLDSDENAFVARFAHRTPDDVPPAELPDYVRYLERYGEGWDPRRHTSTGQSLNVSGDEDRFRTMPRAGVVLTMTRLADRVPDGSPVAAEVRRYLEGAGLDMLEYAYFHDSDLAARAPADCPWKRAEAAWVRWLSGKVASLPDEERLKVLPHLLIRARGDAPQGEQGGAYPGLDRVSLGLSVFDAWIQAGHPVTQAAGGVADTPARKLFDVFVCPRVFGDDGAPQSPPNGCEHEFYKLALDRPDTRARLYDYVAGKKDPALATHVMANLGLTDEGLDLWQHLEGDEASWRAAGHVLADLVYPQDKDRVWPEVTRLWPRHRAKRGTLLYLLTRLDQYHNRDFAWEGVPARLGGPIGAEELGAYMDVSPATVRSVWAVVPALSAGWSRMDVIAPRLSRAIADPPAMRSTSWSWDGLPELANAFCDEGNRADLAKLRAYAVARMHDHPSEQGVMQNVLDVADRCKGRGPKRPERGGPWVE